jgi:hypothetical protein
MDTTIMMVILGLVAGTAAGVFLVWRGWRSKADDSTYHFRCPQCKRRLRYLARQVGHKGKCNHCSREVLFPPTSQSID